MRHVHMGKGHREAARDGTDEIGLAVMATTFAICAVFVPVAFMRRHRRQVLLPVRHHGRGGGAGEPVRQLHARPDAVEHLAATRRRNRLLKLPVIGHLMRGTDRLLDVLHGVYERLIHWIFSGRRYRVLCRRCRRAAGRSAPTASATRARRGAGASPRSRRAALVLLAGIGSFVGAIALAPLVGTEFIPETDHGFTS